MNRPLICGLCVCVGGREEKVGQYLRSVRMLNPPRKTSSPTHLLP